MIGGMRFKREHSERERSSLLAVGQTINLIFQMLLGARNYQSSTTYSFNESGQEITVAHYLGTGDRTEFNQKIKEAS